MSYEIEEMEQAANNYLSNATGRRGGRATGRGQNNISKATQKRFSMQLINAHPTEPRTVYLNPSLKFLDLNGAVPKGTLTDNMTTGIAAIDDIDAVKSIKAKSTSSFGSINFFRANANQNPTFIKSFMVTGNTEADLNYFKIFAEEVSPYGQKTAGELLTADYNSSNANNPKVRNIAADIDMNPNMLVSITLSPASTVTISAILGAEFSAAKQVQ